MREKMNTSKKLICTDLDGTVMFRRENAEGVEGYHISDADRAALIALQQSGHKIAVVTGREKQGIRTFLQNSFVAFDYYVGTNGSLIMNQHFEILHRKTIDANLIEEFLHFMKLHHPEAGMMATTGLKMYFFNGTYENDQVQKQREVEVMTEDDFEPKKHPFIMMNVNLDESYGEGRLEKIAQLESELHERFDGRLNIFRNKDFIDIAPIGNSKGTAVTKIAGLLDIRMEDVYTIGDSWNDLSMLELPDVQSYTFTHADVSLQEKTSYVVSSFAEMAKDILGE